MATSIEQDEKRSLSAMYDPRFVQPMRKELTRLGVTDLTTAEALDATLKQASGTILVVVNSICGCAAGGARPAVALALQHQKLPNQVVTVFAG
jgi:putative YphP/YqiW family bacilliredoxin